MTNDVTGHEVAPVLRSHPDTRTTPIIALTADTSTEAVEKVHLAGCDQNLSKPIRGTPLLKAVKELLGARSPPAPAGSS